MTKLIPPTEIDVEDLSRFGARNSRSTAAKGSSVVVRGEVVPGDQRGRTIGFPTANLLLPDHSPALTDGVYAGMAQLESGDVVPAAISVGRRSTFYGPEGQRLLEAHLLDFDREIYGEQIRLYVHVKLRDQARFDNVEALVAQVNTDVAAVRAEIAGMRAVASREAVSVGTSIS